MGGAAWHSLSNWPPLPRVMQTPSDLCRPLKYTCPHVNQTECYHKARLPKFVLFGYFRGLVVLHSSLDRKRTPQHHSIAVLET